MAVNTMSKESFEMSIVHVILYAVVILVIGVILAAILLRKAEKKKHRFEKFLVGVYVPLTLWSVFYYFWCLDGTGLSMICLWLVLAAFAVVRILLLTALIYDKPLVKVPKVLRRIYRGCFAVGLTVFLIVEGLVLGAMTGDPKENLDYVIVLGAQVKGEEPSPTLEQRINRAAQYLKENPDTLLIASGGQGSDEEISEAECIRRVLVERHGIDPGRILMEDRSTSTAENLRYSMEIIGDANASVGIVTNGFHEYRAMLFARKAGFRALSSVPAKTLLPIGIHYTVREFFGVVSFIIRGR